MKAYLVFGFFILLSDVIVGKCDVLKTWEFGYKDKVLVNTEGTIPWTVKEKHVPLNVSDCYELSYVKVSVKNYLSTPEVTYNNRKQMVTIKYRPLDISESKYTVQAMGHARPDCNPDQPPLQVLTNLNPNPGP
ncbi:uncharacterized protein LOC128669169 [Plodia interpunctella]|uniref:uncharacterized protein LOC128669169 n=1 Tax=Plodia interpunctella TaxID=58824 RepID=UPI002367AFB7|nr:uncharacterized protein LOC128669169 [Plodia interpunctella]